MRVKEGVEMPWFPDIVSAVEPARRQTREAGQGDPVGQYFAALNTDDSHALETVWPGEVVIYDPRAGEVRGHRELRRFVLRNQAWLAERHARIETVAATNAGGRAVVELLTYPADDGSRRHRGDRAHVRAGRLLPGADRARATPIAAPMSCARSSPGASAPAPSGADTRHTDPRTTAVTSAVDSATATPTMTWVADGWRRDRIENGVDRVRGEIDERRRGPVAQGRGGR
jgi:hypothetical protein